MGDESTQELEAFKADVEVRLAEKRGELDVQGVIDAHEAKKKKNRDAQWAPVKATLLKVVLTLAGTGGVGTGVWIQYGPDQVDQQKANDVVHEKLADEVLKSRGHMVDSIQFLGDKIDAEGRGADPAAVAKTPELEASDAEYEEQKMKAAAKELLKLTPEEMKQVKK